MQRIQRAHRRRRRTPPGAHTRPRRCSSKSALLRSAACMEACSSVFQHESVLTLCFCPLRLRVCRCGGGATWRAPAQGLRRAAAVRAVSHSHQPWRPASTAWSRQSAHFMHHASDTSSSTEEHTHSTHQTPLRRHRTDAATGAQKAAPCRHRSSRAADVLSFADLAATSSAFSC